MEERLYELYSEKFFKLVNDIQQDVKREEAMLWEEKNGKENFFFLNNNNTTNQVLLEENEVLIKKVEELKQTLDQLTERTIVLNNRLVKRKVFDVVDEFFQKIESNNHLQKMQVMLANDAYLRWDLFDLKVDDLDLFKKFCLVLNDALRIGTEFLNKNFIDFMSSSNHLCEFVNIFSTDAMNKNVLHILSCKKQNPKKNKLEKKIINSSNNEPTYESPSLMLFSCNNNNNEEEEEENVCLFFEKLIEIHEKSNLLIIRKKIFFLWN